MIPVQDLTVNRIRFQRSTTNDGSTTVLVHIIHVHIQFTYMFKNNSTIPLNFYRFIYVTPLSVGSGTPFFFFYLSLFFCCVWILCVCVYFKFIDAIAACRSFSFLRQRLLTCLPVLLQPLHHCATTSLHMTSCWFHNDCPIKKSKNNT